MRSNQLINSDLAKDREASGTASELANPSEKHPVIIQAFNYYMTWPDILQFRSFKLSKWIQEYRGRGIGTRVVET